jgi:drug/metabolite transporter (DMT)-like permease
MTRTARSQSDTAGGPGLAPLLAVGTTLVLWSSAFVAIRHLGHSVGPGALSLGRLLVASAALGVLLLARGRRRLPARADWPLLVLGGASWFGLYNLSLNESERRIDAGTAALLVQVGPIIVALLATVFLGERLTSSLVIGMAIGFGGVVLIGEASSSHSGGDLVGVLLAVVAAVSFAVGVLSQKRLLRRLSALEVTFWYCLVGTLVCLPWSGQLVHVVGTAPAATLAWIVYLGVFPSAVAFTTWAFALSSADAGRFSLSTFLVPFLTALLAWLTLHEVPPALAFVGGALCIGGVLLTRRRPKAAPSGPAVPVTAEEAGTRA